MCIHGAAAASDAAALRAIAAVYLSVTKTVCGYTTQ